MELGYVLLEHCNVDVTAECHLDQWTEVDVFLGGQERESRDGDNEQPLPTKTAAGDQIETTDRGCCRCNVTIRHRRNGDNDQLYADCTFLESFHGNVREMICHSCKAVRSDFSALLGLIHANKEAVSIHSMQILVKDISTSLLVTLVFKHVPRHRSIFQPNDSVSTKVTKVLPTSMQILLTIVESNWITLQETMESLAMRTKDSSRKAPLPFFPSQMTIAELYRRLENPIRQVQQTKREAYGCLRNVLSDLPPDVWSETLETFLTATDVGALRCSCRALRYVLRSTVPGLKLRLYHHQVESLRWMCERERSVLTEKEILNSDDNDNCNLHRAVTGGLTIQLQARDQTFSIRLDALTGYEYSFPLNITKPRSVARGGMLCDDPGLGKTVTVLALILQTPTAFDNYINDDEVTSYDNDRVGKVQHKVATSTLESDRHAIFYTYWKEEVTKEFRFQDCLKLLNRFCRQVPNNLLPWPELRLALSNGEYGSDFRNFEAAVRSCIEALRDTSGTYLNLWNNTVDEFKAQTMRSVRRYFSNSSSKPMSNVASMFDAENKKKLTLSLVPSSSTLLVVPAVLLDHWQSQIEQHVDWKYWSQKTPFTFVFLPRTSETCLEEAMKTVEEKNQVPVVFIDKSGTAKLPDASFLARFHVVITTTQRFRNEWKKGSFQEEIQFRDSGSTAKYRSVAKRSTNIRSSCELLKIRWKRMIVDEGHSMGNKGNTIQFTRWIQASRRWVMTGTPTKQGGAEMRQLLGLSDFLQHSFFTPSLNGHGHWKRYIAKEWSNGNLGSFLRLRCLLGILMKRHTKLDIQELSPPEYDTTKVPMSSSEVGAYNALVSAAQQNIITTSMDAKTSGLQDSLLHRTQAKHARKQLENLLLVCSGWSRVVPILEREVHYYETLQMAEAFGLSCDEIERVKNYFHRVTSEQQSECGVCAFRVPTHILMPCCAGLICTECMSSNTTTCFLCFMDPMSFVSSNVASKSEKTFDPDELQKFQPGFVMKLDPEAMEQKTNGVSSSFGDENRKTRSNSEWNARQRIFGDGHVCEFDRCYYDGRCCLCLMPHDGCNFMNPQNQCSVCYRMAECCPEDESKSFYLVQKLLQLYEAQQNLNISNKTRAGCNRPLKVIVFSQFRKMLNLIGHRLLKRFGSGCIAEYFGNYRKQELRKFTCDSSCFCLLLTRDGAEGLDLSFVTNIIFLDEIFDKSLREQAVARAWRMGAKGPVKVETLVAKNSVEETMGEFDARRLVSLDSKSEPEKERVKALLESLTLNTDYHYFARTEAIDLPASARKRKQIAVKCEDIVISSTAKRVRFLL